MINKHYYSSLTIGGFFSFFFVFYSSVLSPYISSFGFSEYILGIIFSFLPLVTIIFSPILGLLSDRIGRDKILFLGLFSQAMALLLFLFPSGIFSFIAARFLSGFTAICAGVIVLSRIQDSIKDESNRGKLNGIFLSIRKFARMSAPLIGAFLADMFFIEMPFVISFIGFSVLLSTYFFWRKKNSSKIEKKDFNPLTSIKIFLRNVKLRNMALLGFTMHTRTVIFSIFLPLIIIDMGYGLKEIGFLIFLRGIPGLFQFLWGKLSDKIGSSKVVWGCVFVSSLILFAMGFSKSIFLLAVLILFEGLFDSGWNVSAWSYMSEIAEKNKTQGAVLGSYISLAQIGEFFFSIVGGFLALYFGKENLFFFSGALVIIVSLFLFRSFFEEKPSFSQ
jgi:MFS family permease